MQVRVKVKHKPKVRSAALSCRQMYGVEYKEVYAPMVTLTTVRTILSIVAHFDFELVRMDVIVEVYRLSLRQMTTLVVCRQCTVSDDLA